MEQKQILDILIELNLIDMKYALLNAQKHGSKVNETHWQQLLAKDDLLQKEKKDLKNRLIKSGGNYGNKV